MREDGERMSGWRVKQLRRRTPVYLFPTVLRKDLEDAGLV
jgi:hypothetical protein